MTERPLPVVASMAKAIHDGIKTQTRRLVKPQSLFEGKAGIVARYPNQRGSPFGEVGDRLWLREPARVIDHRIRKDESAMQVQYLADGKVSDWLNVPNRFETDGYPPKWVQNLKGVPNGCIREMSRLTLEITEVRVERVRDIGKDGRKARDVLAEGIMPGLIEREREWFHQDDAPAIAFSRVWDALNGSGSWERNPWVWVICFKAPAVTGASQ